LVAAAARNASMTAYKPVSSTMFEAGLALRSVTLVLSCGGVAMVEAIGMPLLQCREDGR
jgi:hypothetical protein